MKSPMANIMIAAAGNTVAAADLPPGVALTMEIVAVSLPTMTELVAIATDD